MLLCIIFIHLSPFDLFLVLAVLTCLLIPFLLCEIGASQAEKSGITSMHTPAWENDMHFEDGMRMFAYIRPTTSEKSTVPP